MVDHAVQGQRRVQQVGDPACNRQAQSQTLAIAAVTALEFLEHQRLLLARNAGTAVVHANG
ncbi:hypothetical protein D3C81_1711160 [compost metagenome]